MFQRYLYIERWRDADCDCPPAPTVGIEHRSDVVENSPWLAVALSRNFFVFSLLVSKLSQY